jgi:hypothetical protein
MTMQVPDFDLWADETTFVFKGNGRAEYNVLGDSSNVTGMFMPTLDASQSEVGLVSYSGEIEPIVQQSEFKYTSCASWNRFGEISWRSHVMRLRRDYCMA